MEIKYKEPVVWGYNKYTSTKVTTNSLPISVVIRLILFLLKIKVIPGMKDVINPMRVISNEIAKLEALMISKKWVDLNAVEVDRADRWHLWFENESMNKRLDDLYEAQNIISDQIEP